MNKNQKRALGANGGKKTKCKDHFATVRKATGLNNAQLTEIQKGKTALRGVPAHVVQAAKRQLRLGGQA